MNFNPYLVLDVSPNADFEAMRAAYRRLARENHPDIAPDKLAATERMAQINRAWAIVGDAAKRAAFDAQWQFHLAEQARREAQRQESARLEAAAHELLRRQSLRARAGRDAKAKTNTARGARTSASNAAKSARNSGQSAGRSDSPLRFKFAGNSAARSGSSAKSSRDATSRSSSRAATSRDSSRAATSRSASHSGRTFAEETSPRALRLMRKVTLAARVWQRDGNARTAIETCRAVLLADGRNVAARELLAEIYASQNRYELAVMMLDQAIQIAPDDRFLRNKRERLEFTHAPAQSQRAPSRPNFWQRLLARFGGKSV